MVSKLVLLALAILFLSASFCGEPQPEPEAEQEERTATERLQQPRNIYEGNVNENLGELRDDLEETSEDRVRRVEEGY